MTEAIWIIVACITFLGGYFLGHREGSRDEREDIARGISTKHGGRFRE